MMKSLKIFVALAATLISGNMFGQTITANDVTIEQGGTADVTFTITAESKAAIAEFKMTLPEGIAIKYDADEEDYVYTPGADMTLKSHSVTIQKQNNGAWYVLVSNASRKEFKANSGAYLTVTLVASGDAFSGIATMKDIILGDISGKQMNTVTEATFAVTVGGTDGISSINAEESGAAVYNLAGQKVNNAQKGLFIKNGKKFVVK